MIKILRLIGISAAFALVCGCYEEASFENGCTGSSYQEEVKCLRMLVVTNKQVYEHRADSLQYELRILEQKIHYECKPSVSDAHAQ